MRERDYWVRAGLKYARSSRCNHTIHLDNVLMGKLPRDGTLGEKEQIVWFARKIRNHVNPSNLSHLYRHCHAGAHSAD